ncbi:transcriptional regulator MntR [Paenibacillus thiaminolyticus]|uniref:Manganese transport regulator n=1 Tax=Paenibacillus thiaminolyticus TaxID=49283 RepID=A0AAP9DX31_PANTH|nr:transcriptional regulator MntR [Paenibacillus thiaminolyticus]MCY9535239.1 transcriptional regulator MntR [Paenibacillus thiaminolyticus]MCY9602500.1 transcriptional regulator MntR [Paenibacillus thiaminolyticus]MCY9606152.1 transcriptional regulator MntR [Paenibacillus thiaminolyticus]MCY9612537.1 transcriptional regulator MntR [Paenibacillus thiaminolyticus]MCY9620834.1 transcriptional regulator MntR [Paenibacillus thiaminolyticus]
MRTPGMEDHLEQIYLLTRAKGFTRVSDIAQALSIHDSSASKMAQKLGRTGYVQYEKYGRICLTDKGFQVGQQLFNRHQLLEKFLRQIGVQEEQIHQEVEQIEHHFSWSTIARIQELVRFFEEEPIVLREFHKRQTL